MENYKLLKVLNHKDIKQLHFICTNGDCGQFALALSNASGNKYSIYAVLDSEMFDYCSDELGQCESIEEEYGILGAQGGILLHLFVHDGTDFFDVSGKVGIDDLCEYDDHIPDEPVIWELGFPSKELETLVIKNTCCCNTVDYYEKIIKNVMKEVNYLGYTDSIFDYTHVS